MNKFFFDLECHHFPCTQQQPSCETLVLIHGWGCDSNTWQPILSDLQKLANVIAIDLPGFGESEAVETFCLHNILSSIEPLLPQECVLVGWSLGGMIATQLAEKYPSKVVTLITLATNAKFIASEDYKDAMPANINLQFNQSFYDNAQATLKIFSGLIAQGDNNERALVKKIRISHSLEKTNHNWHQALDLLSNLDNRESIKNLQQPSLHFFADGDSLVPKSAAAAVAALNSQHRCIIVPQSAHALHWSQPESLVKIISDFLSDNAKTTVLNIKKQQVANSFSRAAHTYDSVADVQRKSGDKLLSKINASHCPNWVIDLGCGTGFFTEKLASRYPQAQHMGIDIAEGMLQFAQKRTHFKPEVSDILPAFVCADAECLPIATASVDIIFSNFALQWCENLPRLFGEVARVLTSKGQFMFTTLGPKTLHELKFSWQQADDRVHVNQFHERDLLLNSLITADFDIVEFEHAPETLRFDQLSDITQSLKSLGAHNLNRGRALGLTGRRKIEIFKRAYEALREDDKLPATYDIFYVTAKKQ